MHVPLVFGSERVREREGGPGELLDLGQQFRAPDVSLRPAGRAEGPGAGGDDVPGLVGDRHFLSGRDRRAEPQDGDGVLGQGAVVVPVGQVSPMGSLGDVEALLHGEEPGRVPGGQQQAAGRAAAAVR